jgi:hypothetical protein
MRDDERTQGGASGKSEIHERRIERQNDRGVGWAADPDQSVLLCRKETPGADAPKNDQPEDWDDCMRCGD